jgi:hypothetical protein
MPRFRCLVFTSAIVLFLMPLLEASHATPGADVKITNDNNNVDGGTPNPSFDAQNRQANEPTMAISPADPNIVASAANDYGMVTVIGDAWLGVYVSSNGGATWFNTMVPGFPSDTSPTRHPQEAPRRCSPSMAPVTRSFASMPQATSTSRASPSTGTSTRPTSPSTTSSSSRGTTTRRARPRA